MTRSSHAYAYNVVFFTNALLSQEAMNCSSIQATLDDLHTVEGTLAFATMFGVTSVVSLLLIVRGERLLRPLGAAAGAYVSAVVIFVASETVSCEMRLVLATVAAIIGAGVALCILGTGLAIIGGVGLAAVAHVVLDVLPFDDDYDSIVLGRSGVYWGAVGGSFALGAVVTCVQRKPMLRVASALAGGGFAVAAVHIAYARTHDSPPPAIPVAILIASTAVGVLVQSMGRCTLVRHDD